MSLVDEQALPGFVTLELYLIRIGQLDVIVIKVKKCLAATIARLPALSQVRTIHCMYHVCPTGMEIWYHTQSLES